MARSDAPPLTLKVERGPCLVPATPFDAERLDSYRVGSTVRVQFVDTADRPGIKKWWAILNRAVKDCNTPWKNAQQASEAIKLALGIVNYGKTVNGNFMQWPRSLTDMSDADLEEAVRDMTDLLYRITGVDPSEWRKETSDTGEGMPISDSPGIHIPTAPQPGEGGGDIPSVPAPNQQSSEQESDPVLPDEIRRALMEDCIETMLRDAFSLPADKQLEKVNKLEQVYLEPQNLACEEKFVRICAETCRRILNKPGEKERARAYLKGLIR